MSMELTKEILEGNVRLASRLMRSIEDGIPNAVEALKRIYPHTGRAYIIGLTGAPGAGKSTLVDVLISAFRRTQRTVGVIAIDPSSPFTGGAILGDRIRMQKHSTDPGVFIRSLASRGQMGGLATAAVSMIHVMDAMGKDIILVETVGVGQAEVDITRVADTSVVILTPGMGDGIQMMKAGILEAADLFVINKADRDGASHLKVELNGMIESSSNLPGEWKPDVISTEAINDKGTDLLMKGICNHRQFLISSGGMEARRRQRARLELIDAVGSAVRNIIDAGIDGDCFERLVTELAQRKTNPHSAASEIMAILQI